MWHGAARARNDACTYHCIALQRVIGGPCAERACTHLSIYANKCKQLNCDYCAMSATVHVLTATGRQIDVTVDAATTTAAALRQLVCRRLGLSEESVALLHQRRCITVFWDYCSICMSALIFAQFL